MKHLKRFNENENQLSLFPEDKIERTEEWKGYQSKYKDKDGKPKAAHDRSSYNNDYEHLISIFLGQIKCEDKLDEIIPTIDRVNSDDRSMMGKFASEHYRKDVLQYLFDRNKLNTRLCIDWCKHSARLARDNDKKEDIIDFLMRLKN